MRTSIEREAFQQLSQHDGARVPGPRLWIAKDLIGQSDRLFYLCRSERDPDRLIWSARLPRCEFSVADAFALAPSFELAIEKFRFPLACDNVQPINWSQVHHEPIGVGIRVICVMGGGEIGYPEFLAGARGENLANRWLLESIRSHGNLSCCDVTLIEGRQHMAGGGTGELGRAVANDCGGRA